jgi:hypothetical protein
MQTHFSRRASVFRVDMHNQRFAMVRKLAGQRVIQKQVVIAKLQGAGSSFKVERMYKAGTSVKIAIRRKAVKASAVLRAFMPAIALLPETRRVSYCLSILGTFRKT